MGYSPLAYRPIGYRPYGHMAIGPIRDLAIWPFGQFGIWPNLGSGQIWNLGIPGKNLGNLDPGGPPKNRGFVEMTQMRLRGLGSQYQKQGLFGYLDL